jgi:hypothetical protein
MDPEPTLEDLTQQRELLLARLDRLIDAGGPDADKEALAKQINAVGDQIEKLKTGG